MACRCAPRRHRAALDTGPGDVTFSMASVRPEQGPPLVVPLALFFTGPLALVVAGTLVLVRGGEGLSATTGSTTLAAVHLGSVGFLLFVMLGALYQLLPTIAGAVVPGVRLAHLVHALLVAGAAALAVGQAGGPPHAFAWAGFALLAALVLFLGPAGFALARSRVGGPTVWGLRIALLALAALAFAGLRLAGIRSGAALASDWATAASWPALRVVHAHLGFLPWMGGLITAVSWQVVPMFYLAPAPPRALPWVTHGGVAVSLCGLFAGLFVPISPAAVVWLALPGALAVWGVHPAWTLVALRRRSRRRKDATLWFWWLAMGVAPLCLAAGAASAALDSTRLPLAYGVLVLFGWAGSLAHGMLTRIVPFLVWLHWCAPLVGTRPMPSARELLPHGHVAIGFAAQAGTLVAGLGASALDSSAAWCVFGAGLATTGCVLLWEMATALRRGLTARRAPAATGV